MRLISSAFLLSVACTANYPSKPKTIVPTMQTAEWTKPWWNTRHQSVLEKTKNNKEYDFILIGDSITQEWESKGKAAWKENFGSAKVLNLGFSGDRTEHVLWRLEHGELDGISAKTVVLQIGTNNTGQRGDPAGDTALGIKAILKKVRSKLPTTKIVLFGLFPREEKSNHKNQQINVEINEIIRTYADGQKVFYLDIGDEFLGNDGQINVELMPDYLHLSPRGYEIWVKALSHLQRAVPSTFTDIESLNNTFVMDIRYYGNHNFIGKRIDGYHAPKCFLTNQAAQALVKVQKELTNFGMSLIVYDCYRPQRAVNHFVRWAKDLRDTKMKSIFYPNVRKENLFKDGYIAAKSGHSRGSTIDLGIVWNSEKPNHYLANRRYDCRKPKGLTWLGNFGTHYDCFDPLSHTQNSKIDPKAKAMRALLVQVMSRYGFSNYEKEWWHFTLENEPFPDQYFDFSVH